MALQQCACLRPRDLYRRESTWLSEPFCSLKGEFQGMPVGFFKFEYISHCQLQIRVVNPFLSHFLPSFFHGRSALLKSSGRTRRQRAGGLRRVSRSGCWRGWPWWPGSWWAHSSPRNACEGRSTTTFPTLFPDLPPSFPSTYTIRKLKWRSCLSRQNCWWCLLLFFFSLTHLMVD